MTREVTYDRPVPAKLLVVRLGNGDEWEAGPDDWSKFGLVRALDAYAAFERHVRTVLTDAGLLKGDLTKAQINPLRYIVELAINYPELLAHPEMVDTDLDLVAIERALAAAAERGEAP